MHNNTSNNLYRNIDIEDEYKLEEKNKDILSSDTQTNIDIEYLLNCSSEAVYSWLKSNLPNYEGDYSFIEETLSKLNDDLINIGLARYGRSAVPFLNLYPTANKRLKTALLKYSWAIGVRGYDDIIEKDIVTDYSMLKAVVGNASLDNSVLIDFINKNGIFKSVDNKHYHHSVSDVFLKRSFSSNWNDFSLTDRKKEVFDTIWNLTQSYPVDEYHSNLLCDFLKILTDVNYTLQIETIYPALEKWKSNEENEEYSHLQKKMIDLIDVKYSDQLLNTDNKYYNASFLRRFIGFQDHFDKIAIKLKDKKFNKIFRDNIVLNKGLWSTIGGRIYLKDFYRKHLNYEFTFFNERHKNVFFWDDYEKVRSNFPELFVDKYIDGEFIKEEGVTKENWAVFTRIKGLESLLNSTIVIGFFVSILLFLTVIYNNQ